MGLKRKHLLGTAVAGAVALMMGGTAGAETLKEVVAYTVETNPQVTTLVNRKEAADKAISGARGGYFPKADLIWGTGSERSKNPTTLAFTPGYVHLHRKEESIIINQMIWDGLGVNSEVNRRGAISNSTAYRVYGTAEDVGLQAIEAYLDVIKNRELVAFAKDNLAAHDKTFGQVKLRSEKGVGRRADLDQIDARLALAQSNLAAAESNLRDAEITYLKIVGKAPVNLTMPAAPHNVPRSVDEAVKTALANHPVLKSAQADVDAAQAQRDIAKSFFSPRLELQASYSQNHNIDGLEGPNNDRLVMLFVKWNMFRGGSDYYRVQETSQQITEATEISRNTARQVEAAVRLAYNAYATARDRLPSLERYVKSSDVTREAYRKQFDIGQRTLLDLLDSENEFFTARSTYTNGKFIELAGRYRVLQAMGQLLTTLDVKPPEQAIVKSN